MIQPGFPSGRIYAGNSPGGLKLVTFIPAAPWKALTPSDREYDLFLWAWRKQPFPAVDHRPFWTATLPLWPRQRGNRRISDYHAQWLVALRHRGYTDRQAAEWLDYPLDTLRSEKVLQRADQIELDLKRFNSNYLELPVVWAPDVDGPAPAEVGWPVCGIGWPSSSQIRRMRQCVDASRASGKTRRSNPTFATCQLHRQGCRPPEPSSGSN
jgi:hypothetical protein